MHDCFIYYWQTPICLERCHLGFGVTLDIGFRDYISVWQESSSSEYSENIVQSSNCVLVYPNSYSFLNLVEDMKWSVLRYDIMLW